MGDGSVKFPYYKTGGKYKQAGLRNKRKAHWSKIRDEERRAKEAKEKAAERAEQDWERQWEGMG